ncbi:MAG: hypothetical protein QM639_15260 [Rhodocyclaceae bacterium]
MMPGEARLSAPVARRPPAAPWRWADAVLGVLEYRAALLILILVAPCAVYQHLPLPGWPGVALAAGLGLAVSACLGGLSLRWRPTLPALPRPAIILAVGLAAQVACAAWTAPTQQSDMASYLALAERLAHGLPYLDEAGRIAYWPAGLPFYLSPFVALFGAGVLAIWAANAVLYVAGGWAILSLGRQCLPETAARAALIVFTLWPSRLLLAGLAAKELLTVSCVTAALALLLACRGRRGDGPRALLAGLALGLAALAQPGLLLLALLLPLALRARLVALGPARALSCALCVACGVAVCLAPWMLRNCAATDGAFCGVASNGGDSFYRANNPRATGLWTERGEVSLDGLGELDKNRVGFALGKEWWRSHPVDGLKLSVRKFIYFVQGDEHGVYWALERAGASVGTVRAGYTVSLVFWLLLAGLALRGLRRTHATTHAAAGMDPSARRLMLYPLLYGVAVFALFESGDRQHMFAVPGLIVLALWPLACRDAA